MPRPGLRLMTLVLAFVINAGLNFVLGLAVAKFLGPDLFGRYAVAMAVAVVVNTTCFEWLRLSATRFYSDRAIENAPAVRAGASSARSPARWRLPGSCSRRC